MTDATKAPPAAPAVQVLPPRRALQAKIGGSAESLLAPKGIAEADRQLSLEAAGVLAEIEHKITEINDLTRQRPFDFATEVHERAHFVRSLAGTFDRPRLGRAADLLCKYLDDVPAGLKADANLVTLLAVTILHLARNEGADPALAQELLGECADAVGVVLSREGRAA